MKLIFFLYLGIHLFDSVQSFGCSQAYLQMPQEIPHIESVICQDSMSYVANIHIWVDIQKSSKLSQLFASFGTKTFCANQIARFFDIKCLLNRLFF